MLLRNISRISGPVSYFVFKMPGTGNTVYMFGDHHFSYKNQCKECRGQDGCVHITDFVDLVLEDGMRTGKSVDVFMEFPYVTADKEMRAKDMQRITEMFTRDSRVSLNKVLGYFGYQGDIFGKSPEYIGIFSLLYKRFAKNFYNHPPGPNVHRFHYADARTEPNVVRFLTPVSRKWIDMFHRRVPDVRTFRRVLEAFLFPRMNFHDEMHAIFGEVFGVQPAPDLHKIAKQVHKLPAALRGNLESYISEKLDTICDILKGDLQYEDGVRLLTPRATKETSKIVPMIRGSRRKNYIDIFVIFMELIVKTIMMDVYLLARMLFYMDREGGTTLVYTGDYHVGVYADFFTRSMKLPPLGCALKFPMKLNDQSMQSMVQRCVHVNLGTCEFIEKKK